MVGKEKQVDILPSLSHMLSDFLRLCAIFSSQMPPWKKNCPRTSNTQATSCHVSDSRHEQTIISFCIVCNSGQVYCVETNVLLLLFKTCPDRFPRCPEESFHVQCVIPWTALEKHAETHALWYIVLCMNSFYACLCYCVACIEQRNRRIMWAN